MPRMERADGREQVQAKLDAELKERYQDVLEVQDKSMSEDLREHVETVVERHDDESDRVELPDDKLLADGYTLLAKIVPPTTRRVDVESAKTQLAERLRDVKKDQVRSRILEPLEQLGYIRPEWGKLYVYPPESDPVRD